MKKRTPFLAMITTILFGLTSTAFAEPKIDLIPTNLRFKIGLDDDVSMSKSQHVSIDVRSVGTIPFRNARPMMVLIKNRIYSGTVYAPASRGGVAGGPINLGETGLLFVRLPLGTIRHCENVLVHIDTAQNMQHGTSVFSNDQKTLQAQEFGNPRPCLFQPTPPVVRSDF